MLTRRLARPLGRLFSAPQGTWTCPSCTRATLPVLPRQHRLQQRRGIRNIAPLAHDVEFSEKGVNGLLSIEGYSIAWTQYQQSIVNKLNELTAGEPYENMDARELALQFAKDPMSASLFNYASMAYNNAFFFRGFAPEPDRLEQHPELRTRLVDTFGSIENLRTTMLETAASMFGPGFVWLVYCPNLAADGEIAASYSADKGTFRILTTYLAGSPFPEAGYRQQGIDSSTVNAAGYQAYQTDRQRSLGSFGSWSASGQAQAKIPPGGTRLIPALCVNTWEHVWLYDFGIAGKRQYLAKWWNCIDWYNVKNNVPMNTLKFESTNRRY